MLDPDQGPRPAIVEEYRSRLAAARVRWKGFRLLTWASTVAIGAYLLLDPHRVNETRRGEDHVLRGLRDGFWLQYNRVVFGVDHRPLPPAVSRGRVRAEDAAREDERRGADETRA